MGAPPVARFFMLAFLVSGLSTAHAAVRSTEAAGKILLRLGLTHVTNASNGQINISKRSFTIFACDISKARLCQQAAQQCQNNICNHSTPDNYKACLAGCMDRYKECKENYAECE